MSFKPDPPKRKTWVARIVEDFEDNPHIPYRVDIEDSDGNVLVHGPNMCRTVTDATDHARHGLLYIIGCEGSKR